MQSSMCRFIFIPFFQACNSLRTVHCARCTSVQLKLDNSMCLKVKRQPPIALPFSLPIVHWFVEYIVRAYMFRLEAFSC